MKTEFAKEEVAVDAVVDVLDAVAVVGGEVCIGVFVALVVPVHRQEVGGAVEVLGAGDVVEREADLAIEINVDERGISLQPGTDEVHAVELHHP